MNKKFFSLMVVIFIFISIHTTAYSLNNTSNINLAANNISSDSLQNLSETIAALDITRSKYQSEIHLQNSSLKKEYLIFIDYLSFQINNYCDELNKIYGEEAIKKLPCYSNNMAVINDNYETPEEKIQSLDDEFMTALGEFDEMLLNEEEKIAQTSQNKVVQRKNNNAGKGNMAGRDAAAADNNELKEQSEKNKSNNNQENNQQSGSRGNGKQSSRKNYQRKKLDKIDDDIVARQLKEAAEKETDQALKEKLWDEYYKYKKILVNNDGSK